MITDAHELALALMEQNDLPVFIVTTDCDKCTVRSIQEINGKILIGVDYTDE